MSARCRLVKRFFGQRRTYASLASLPFLATKRYRAPFLWTRRSFQLLAPLPRARSSFLYFFFASNTYPHYIPIMLLVFYLFLQQPLLYLLLPYPIINAPTFYHHITNPSPFFVELLFVRKLLHIDFQLRCIRPDLDDFRSENVKSANHRPLFPSKSEYRPLIG